MSKILVVDDERLIVKGIKFSLTQDGMDVSVAYDGEEALSLAEKEDFDLILLDVMLPKVDGLEVCSRIREFSSVPIIMVTAKGEDIDKIMGLELGADDYITKPFAIEEVLARMRVALKHRKTAEGENPTRLSVKDLTLDLGKRTVKLGNNNIDLTKREFDLLAYLIKNKNIVISREQILNKVWGYDYFGETNVVDVYIRYLRTKIDDKYGEKFIHTIRGVGYYVKDDED